MEPSETAMITCAHFIEVPRCTLAEKDGQHGANLSHNGVLGQLGEQRSKTRRQLCSIRFGSFKNTRLSQTSVLIPAAVARGFTRAP